MTTSAAAPWPWALVPRGVSDDLRPNIERVVAEVIAAVRDEVPEYDRPLEGEFGRLISQGVGVALNQFVDLIGRDLPPPDVTIYEAMGREEHRRGRTLDALQSAYRVGARVSWRSVATSGRTPGSHRTSCTGSRRRSSRTSTGSPPRRWPGTRKGSRCARARSKRAGRVSWNCW